MATVQDEKVLVLNRNWNAVAVAPLLKAVNLVLKGSAKIIDPSRQFQTFTWATWSALRPKEGEDYIAAANIYFCIPRVILLGTYDRVPLQKLNFSRRQIFKRDKNQCQYCGCRPGTNLLNIDHVTPRSMGGLTNWENCVISCLKCNSRKRNRTPEQANMKLLKKPERPHADFIRFDGIKLIKDWQMWVSESFWNVTLENDMGE